MKEEVTKQAVESTQAVETKLIDMLDALQNGVVQIGEEAVKYAPEVAETAMWVVRIDAIQCLTTALAFLVPLIYISCRLYRFARQWHKGHSLYWNNIGDIEEENERYKNIEPAMLSYTGSILFGIGAARALFVILNVWNWVAIFEPKLYIAKQIIEKTIGG